jgi:hypothetical protein
MPAIGLLAAAAFVVISPLRLYYALSGQRRSWFRLLPGASLLAASGLAMLVAALLIVTS